MFTTPIRDSLSRLELATPLATPDRVTNSLFIVATSVVRLPTDRRTVLTPQCHLPSIPTLTLIKKFGTFSLAWPLPLPTTRHHAHHP